MKAPEAAVGVPGLFNDKALDRRVDNGNHLVLSANRATFRFLGLIGAYDGLTGPGAPIFPWHDVATGESWVLRLNEGRFPFWAFCPSRRVPGMRWRDLAVMLRLLRCQPDDVGGVLPRKRCFIPTITGPVRGFRFEYADQCGGGFASEKGRSGMPSSRRADMSAFLPETWPVGNVCDTSRGPSARMRAEVRTGCRVTGLQIQEGRVSGLEVGAEVIEIAQDDQIVLATPAPVRPACSSPSGRN